MKRFPFKEGVHYRVEARGCWRWLRARKGKEAAAGTGYPCVSVRGKCLGAHRIACAWKHGTAGEQTRHTCHNTLCINPAHLLPGTQKENMRDSAIAGRRPHKLTLRAVRRIKRAYNSGETQDNIAKHHGIAQADVSHIVNGHYWAHVDA